VTANRAKLSLTQLLQHFWRYRSHTIIRRTRHALKRTEDAFEVVEGLIRALDSLPDG